MSFIRLALRRTKKHPAFSVVVTGILAIGIGANVVVLAVLNSVAFGRLPYPDSERLVAIGMVSGKCSYCFRQSVPRATYERWVTSARSVEQWGAYHWIPTGLTLTDHKRELRGIAITPSTLSLLGAKMLAGRPFDPEDDRPGAEPKIILSYDFWRRVFHSDTALVGSKLVINKDTFSVAGVTAASFVWLQGNMPDVLMTPAAIDANHSIPVFAIAKLRSGSSLPQMDAELAQLGASPTARPNLRPNELRAAPEPMRMQLVIGSAVELTIIQFLAVLVLIITCANVAGLLLARMQAESVNVGVRVLLGARLRDLWVVPFADIFPLVMVGAGVGLAVAYGVVPFVAQFLGSAVPAWADVRIDSRVAVGTVALAALSALAIAAAPSREFFQTDLRSWLQEGGRTLTAGTRGRRRQRNVVTLQLALSTTLLVMGALLVSNYVRLTADDDAVLGQGSMKASLTVPAVARVDSTVRTITDRIGIVPGVTGVALSERKTLGLSANRSPTLYIDGSSEQARVVGSPISAYAISSPLLVAFLIRPHDGRDFTKSEIATVDTGVAIVNDRFAAMLWGGETGVGHRIRFANNGGWRTVVGVIRNSTVNYYVAAREAQATPTIYFPGLGSNARNLVLTVRTHGDADSLIDEVATTAEGAAPHSVGLFLSSDYAIREARTAARIRTFLLALLACLAVVLSTVGLASLVAFSTGLRKREFGIRTAVGATAGAIGLAVIRDALRLSLPGVALGLVGSTAAVFLFIPMVYFGNHIFDWRALLGVSACMTTLTIVASLGPAVRAARVPPGEVLRAE